MKRLTTDDEKSIVFSLNTFYAKDGEVWIRGGGPYPDYPDCTLVQWIKSAAEKHNLCIEGEDPEHLGDEMYDALQDGDETVEGILALMHLAAVEATEMRERLKLLEDILGDDYNPDKLRELMDADRAGRIKVLTEATGQVCGTCANFQRARGRKSGTCKVKKFCTDRWGRVDKMRGQFTTAQSRKACAKYEPEKPPSLAEEVRDRFFCRRNRVCMAACSTCDDYGECYACVSCGMPDRCQLCERYYTKEQAEQEAWVESKTNTGIEIVFFKNGKQIGKARVSDLDGKKLNFLHDFEVEKGYRNMGFGGKILEVLISAYKVDTLYVDDDNKIALKLYEKYGFQTIDCFLKNGKKMRQMQRKIMEVQPKIATDAMQRAGQLEQEE